MTARTTTETTAVGTPLRPNGPQARRALVEELVRKTAAEVLLRKGIANTSLGDIAEAVGVGRTALYHYYGSKEELLVAVMTECALEARQILASTTEAGSTRSLAEKLHDAVRQLATFALESPERVRLLDTAAGLPPEAQEIASELNRLFFADLRTLIRRGIEAGDLLPVDEGVAAHAIVGSTRSLAWWFDPAGPRSADFVARQIADTALRGLLADPPRQPAPEVVATLASLRRNVDVLAQSLLDSSLPSDDL